MRRRELRAPFDSQRALADILARKAVVLVMVELIRHEDAVILHRDVFLAHDAVTALRDGRARHQAHGRALWYFLREESPAHSSPMMRKEAGASSFAPFVPEAAKA